MYKHADQLQNKDRQKLSSANSETQSGSLSRFRYVDNRPISIVQRKLQDSADNSTSPQKQSIQRKELECIQRMPRDRAERVNVTFNSVYHVGNRPIESAQDAIALTQARMNTNWNGPRNHVVYDFNRTNLEQMLYQSLVNDEYFLEPNGHYLVPLPEVNYYIVDRNLNCVLGGGQAAMLVDNANMNAYHMLFY